MGENKLKKNKAGRWCFVRSNGWLAHPVKWVYYVNGEGPYSTVSRLCLDYGINYFSLMAIKGWPKQIKTFKIERHGN